MSFFSSTLSQVLRLLKVILLRTRGIARLPNISRLCRTEADKLKWFTFIEKLTKWRTYSLTSVTAKL
ncbi:hypothetical protein LINPERHAP1_LOCUS8523 [Linum perenne]